MGEIITKLLCCVRLVVYGMRTIVLYIFLITPKLLYRISCGFFANVYRLFEINELGSPAVKNSFGFNITLRLCS